MKRFTSFVFIISFVVAQSAFAETTISPTNSYPSAGSGGSGTNNTAKQASSGAGIAQMVSAATAAVALSKCPTSPVFCAIGAANVAAALMMGGGKKNAGNIDKATLATTGAGAINGVQGPGEGFESGSGSGIDAQLEDLRQQFADLGYTMSADGSTLTTPSGAKVSTAAIASGNAPGFEMTDSVRQELAAIEADALKKSGNRVVPIGLQDGGGGGGGGSGLANAEDSSSKFDMNKYLRGLKNRDPSSVSGLSKKLGEDNIGIATDNIFEMVSRQYKRKQSQSAFIK